MEFDNSQAQVFEFWVECRRPTCRAKKCKWNQWQLSSSASIDCDDERLAKASEGKARQKMQLQTRMASFFFFLGIGRKCSVARSWKRHKRWEKKVQKRSWPVPIKGKSDHKNQHHNATRRPANPPARLAFRRQSSKTTRKRGKAQQKRPHLICLQLQRHLPL